MSLAERIHQFLECCCTFDLKEDLVIIVGNLNVEMLALATLRLLLGTGTSVLICRHVAGGSVRA